MDFDRGNDSPFPDFGFVLFPLFFVFCQGASILTGLGFTDIVNGEPQWDGAANVKVWQIELPSNFKVLLDSWNMKTNVWLRECVYKRVTPKGKKPGNRSSMITFFTSAFWVCFHFFSSKRSIHLSLNLAWFRKWILPHFSYGRFHHLCRTSCPSKYSPSRPPHLAQFTESVRQARL